jgi:Tat protein secretion system quality control protein TatD with DNase activity
MEIKEILLETDAPFLPPYPECKMNHPWNLEVVAQVMYNKTHHFTSVYKK